MALTKVIGSGLGAIPAISGANLTGLTDSQMPAGSVLQTINHLEGSAFSTTSTSLVNTNIVATITPSSTSSKILVLVNAQISASGTTYVYGQMSVTRTPSGGSATTIIDCPRIDLYSQYNHHVYSVNTLDSPSSTAAITYQVKVRTSNASQGIDCPHHINDCSITLMEIAG